MVLRFWGDAAAHERWRAELSAAELRGVAGSRLAEAARQRGMTAVAYQGDDAQLRAFVAKGRPLVVAWDMGRGRFHDVVVVGFEGDDVVVHDPARGPSRRVPGRGVRPPLGGRRALDAAGDARSPVIVALLVALQAATPSPDTTRSSRRCRRGARRPHGGCEADLRPRGRPRPRPA
jgi:hypothetical protein